jgi:tetratricopeptide (TPR) repeat protein
MLSNLKFTFILILPVFVGLSFDWDAKAQEPNSFSRNDIYNRIELTSNNIECRYSGSHLMASNLYQASPEVQELLAKAEIATQENRDNDAVASWTRALELDPNVPEALLRRGSLYILQRNFDQGLADFRKLESFYKEQGNSSYADIITQLIKDTQQGIASGELDEQLVS